MRVDSPLAFGFRDKEGPSLLAWGEEIPAEGSPLTLRFRDFHYPGNRLGSDWDSFPSQGCWSLSHLEEKEFSASFPALSLGFPVEIPDSEGWRSFCGKIENHLAAGSLKKAVPARSRIYSLPPATAARLREELLPRLFSGPSNGAFRFFLKSGESWFFGATPEMLFRREGKNLLVPAIAGTRAFTPGADTAALSEELLANKKERSEHSLVVEGIKEKLSSLGLKPRAPAEPVVMKLRSLIHLYTPVTAEGEVATDKLLSLHPTAAVGGTPQEYARDFLRENEPLERGLFASPLLFRFPGKEICLVAIRSGLLEGNRLHLFAGAGYVKGSDPGAEWAETGKKMDSLKLLLEEERI
jgi:menaquinone-specific isochorismate synthase